jgi:hypothetical protein
MLYRFVNLFYGRSSGEWLVIFSIVVVGTVVAFNC